MMYAWYLVQDGCLISYSDGDTLSPSPVPPSTPSISSSVSSMETRVILPTMVLKKKKHSREIRAALLLACFPNLGPQKKELGRGCLLTLFSLVLPLGPLSDSFFPLQRQTQVANRRSLQVSGSCLPRSWETYSQSCLCDTFFNKSVKQK